MNKKIKLQNVVWKEGRYFVAQCLNVEVSSFGKSKKEALCNLEEALELYFENKKKINIAEVNQPEIAKCSLIYA